MHNFYERISDAAGRFRDRAAVEWVGATGVETTTYDALMADARQAAAWLTGPLGLTSGDRIAIFASNDARWIAVYLGALSRGLVVVPLDTSYSAAQVHTVMADSGARVLFTTPRYVTTAREAVSRAGADAPSLALLSGAADGAAGPDVWRQQEDTRAPADVGVNAPAVILYTSGTTADPKGVVLTHGNLDAERESVLAVVKADERDVVLGVLPLFHALAEMANLWLPLSIGAKLVFLETVSSATLVSALQTRGITILACVPQFFYLIHQRVVGEMARKHAIVRSLFRLLLTVNRVLRDRFGWNPGRRVFARVHQALGANMRLLITGGSHFDPAVARDLYGLGVSLYNGYGLTETSGAAAIVRFGDRFTTSVGPAIPGVAIRIGDRSVGNPAEQQGDGEVLIRGPIVMREYWRRPDATGQVIVDGWLHTGDLGRLDADGRLYITGRLKEIIVLASGKNLYPEEIEAHYRKSMFIKEMCVLGLRRPDDPTTERLHAVVVPDEQVLRERGIVNVRELIRFEIEGLSVQLPAHKRILTYDISLEPLARTTTGKLKRGEIERRAQAREQDVQTPSRELTASERDWLAAADHAALVTTIATALGLDRLAPDANLELDLGLDSMERVELLTTVEARLRRQVAPEARATIFTVRQLVDAVERGAETRSGAAPATDATLPWETILAEPADPALVRELTRSKLVRSFVIWVCLRGCLAAARLVLGVRVAGVEHIPARAPFIVSPNHQTFLDGFFVAAALPFRAFRHIFFVGAAEFFETRVMAWGARAINIVPLDPDANLVSAMRAAATGLKLGKMLMLFPEGERTIDGSVKAFRKGAAILGSHLDVSIVPVGIEGFFELWPRGRRFQWRALVPGRTRRTIAFGAPLRIARGAYAEGTDQLRRAVVQIIDEQG